MKTKAIQYLLTFPFLALGMALGYGLSVLCPYSEDPSKGGAESKVFTVPERPRLNPAPTVQFGTETGEAYLRPESLMDWNGVVVVAHSQNPVAEIEAEDLDEIIMGKHCNWDEIGGRSSKIKVVTSHSFAEDLDRSLAGVKASRGPVEITTYTYPSAIIPHVATDLGAMGLIPVTGELQRRFASRHHSLKHIRVKTGSIASAGSRFSSNSESRERRFDPGKVPAWHPRDGAPRICPKHTEILRTWLNNGTSEPARLETLIRRVSMETATLASQQRACVVCQLTRRGSQQCLRHLDYSARR